MQTTVPTDSLGLVNFGREVIRKESLVNEVVALQKTVSKKTAAWEGVEKRVTELKGSVLVSDTLVASLAESDQSSVPICVEVSLLKVHVARIDTEKRNSNKLLSQVCDEAEKPMICLNVAIASRNRAEKLAYM